MAVPAARRELKYVIPTELVDELRAALTGLCELDAHSDGREAHRYVINTLYLDGPGLPFYRAKVDRAKKRLKLRVRTYDDAWERGFLEVKRKDGDVVRKTRAPFTGVWADALRDPATPTAHDFAAVAALTGAEPTMWVRYEREAWTGVVEDYARVTFDYRMVFQPADGVRLGAMHPDAEAWRPIDDGYTEKAAGSYVILELKFERAAPMWMASLVRRFDLFRHGYSKYCAGVDHLWGRYRPIERLGRYPVLG